VSYAAKVISRWVQVVCGQSSFSGLVTLTQPRTTLLSAALLLSVLMNMLVDGEVANRHVSGDQRRGAFVGGRRPVQELDCWLRRCREHIEAEPDDRFEAEAGRYHHLYVSYACPWAHAPCSFRALMGLEDAIDISVVGPIATMTAGSSPPRRRVYRGQTYRSDYLRELYVEADPDATCRVTVPVLWDTKERDHRQQPESREIIRMLSTGFGDVAERDVDLAPEAIREEVDGYHHRYLRADQQRGLPGRIRDQTGPLRRGRRRTVRRPRPLGFGPRDQRFLAGDQLTEADICMFTTLIRFDHVYHTHFMCNVQYIHQYQYLTASSAGCFCGLSSVSKRFVLTVSTRITDGSTEAVAVGGGQPPTRQHLLTPAGLLGRWLAVESVVRWPIRGDGPTHREAVHAARRIILTNSLYGHHQRRRPPRRASPHTRSEGTARRSVRETHHHVQQPYRWISCCRCRYRFQTSDKATRYRSVSSSGIRRPVVSR